MWWPQNRGPVVEAIGPAHANTHVSNILTEEAPFNGSAGFRTGPGPGQARLVPAVPVTSQRSGR